MTTTEVKTLEGISSETAQALAARAAAAGLSPDDYLKSLLGLTNGTGHGAQPNRDEMTEAAAERPFYETATPEEWIRELNEWASSHDPNTPVILDDSREVIYEDDER